MQEQYLKVVTLYIYIYIYVEQTTDHIRIAHERILLLGKN